MVTSAESSTQELAAVARAPSYCSDGSEDDVSLYACLPGLHPVEEDFLIKLHDIGREYAEHVTDLHNRDREIAQECLRLRARCRLLEDHRWMMETVLEANRLEVPLEPQSQYTL